MCISKNSIISSISILTVLNSEIALAANDGFSELLPPIWPFFLVIGLIFIFRKQLNCVPHQDLSEVSPVVNNAQPVAKVAVSTANESPSATESSAKPIDLTDNSHQCQASTAKGTRCKRKNTLEEVTITLDGVLYKLTTCAQHNNDALKPYPGLIK